MLGRTYCHSKVDNILADGLCVCLKDSGGRYIIYMFKDGSFLLEYLNTKCFLGKCKELYVFDSRFKQRCWSRMLLSDGKFHDQSDSSVPGIRSHEQGSFRSISRRTCR